ncbi:TPA: hypothetical protein O1V27_002838 [Staphylococcus aureus]|nr:hypothetical protein [Staphylococcus aureus]
MIDPANQQTQALPLDEQPAKRKRGRPATGKAMTPAEKQRAYRERMKSRNVTGNAVPSELLEKVRATDAERIEQLEQQLAAAIARAEKAESKLKRNVTVKQKRRYVLQFKYESANGVEWVDDKTGDYGSKKQADKACKDMNARLGKSEHATEWRVRERQWV